MVGGRVAGLTLAVLMLGGHQPPSTSDAGWQLVWHDEFNARDGSRPDPSKWTHDVGGHGWGNQELQYYTARAANSEVRSGSLHIRAVRETYTGADRVVRTFTSARLHSMGRFAATYGRFEARIKLPGGTGLWSAFWLLGNDYKTTGWPGCGEIDILENVGSELSTVHGTIHGPGYSHAAGISSSYRLPARQTVTGFHVYSLEWEPDALRFYVDGTLYRTTSRQDLPRGAKWAFDHPFFIIFNLAVGGDWPGDPAPATRFPQAMVIDYVRVYQRPSANSLE